MAASDESRLVVRLEASVTQLTKELTKVRQHTETEMGLMVRGIDRGLATIERRRAPRLGIADAVQRETQAASRSLSTLQRDLNRTAITNTSALSNSLRTSLAAAAGTLSVREIAKYSDADTRIKNSLKVAGLEGEELAKTYDKLFESAQKQGVPLEALSTLYGRLSLSQKELNVTTPELIKFTDGVALALKVSGQSAAEASGALLQLSQALGGGKIQAEEYNSLIDGARPVLQAVAAGLEEAGGSVSKLTALVKDGKVSSEAFFRAFEAGRPILDEMAANTSATLAQQFQRVENALTRVVGEMSAMAGATDLVKQAMEALISVINQAPEIFARDLADLEKIAKIATTIANAIKTAAGTIGIIRQEPLPADSDDPPPLAIRVKPKAPNREIESSGIGPVRTVSLKSFKLPGDDDKKGGGGSEKQDEYEREIANIEKRTRAFDSERESLGKSATEAAKAEASFRLLEAAKKANLPITDELRAKVDTLATAYAGAKVQLDEAEAAQRRTMEQQRYLGAAMTDAVSDFVIEGRSATEVFDNLAKSIAKAVLQAALMGSGPLSGLFGAASSGGGMGGLFGSLLGGIGKSTGGVDVGLNFFGGGAKDGYVPKFAAGVSSLGAISGPGTGTSDSILALGPNGPIRVSDGESIVTARATRQHRPLIEAMNANRLPSFAGGIVGAAADGLRMPMADMARRDAAAAQSAGARAEPSIKFIVNEAPGGDKVGAQDTRRGPDGGIEVVAEMLERRQAQKIGRNRGPVADALAARGQLRGA